MKRWVLAVAAFCVILGASLATEVPPDYDYAFKYMNMPPIELSAGWVGDDVYISWNKQKDKNYNDAGGYRLYRASEKDGAFAMIQIHDEDKDTLGYSNVCMNYYDYGIYRCDKLVTYVENVIPVAYYTDNAMDLANAGVALYEAEPFYYKVTALAIETVEGSYNSYRLYESRYSDPVEIVKEIETGFGCFIASAAFGSPYEKEVVTLSLFRDRILLQNSAGRQLVRSYYRISPAIAGLIEQSAVLKFLVRIHLKPLTKLCRVVLYLMPKLS